MARKSMNENCSADYAFRIDSQLWATFDRVCASLPMKPLRTTVLRSLIEEDVASDAKVDLRESLVDNAPTPSPGQARSTLPIQPSLKEAFQFKYRHLHPLALRSLIAKFVRDHA